MYTKSLFNFILAFLLFVAALTVPYKSVYAVTCDPSTSGSESYDAGYCKTNSPCQRDCVQAPDKPAGWVCCPEGCVGEPCQPGEICFTNPLSSCTIDDLVESVMNFILTVGLAISVLMVVVAAYYFLTSGGDPKKYKKSIDIVKYVFIGVCILLLAKGIVFTIKWIVGA